MLRSLSYSVLLSGSVGMEDLPPRTSSLAIDSSGRIPLVPRGDSEGLQTITGLGSVTQELEVSPLHTSAAVHPVTLDQGPKTTRQRQVQSSFCCVCTS